MKFKFSFFLWNYIDHNKTVHGCTFFNEQVNEMFLSDFFITSN